LRAPNSTKTIRGTKQHHARFLLKIKIMLCTRARVLATAADALSERRTMLLTALTDRSNSVDR
jgi:hypothetical protein